jgi:branched-chain amino acid transport system substrate-binding protein
LGLSCEVWWSEHHPYSSSLTNETAKALCQARTKETGRQWTQPIGFKHAGVEIIYDVLTRAGNLDKTKVLEALKSTDLKTIVGPIRFNDLHYSETPLVGGQWQKGANWPCELEITYSNIPEIKTTKELIFPLPS